MTSMLAAIPYRTFPEIHLGPIDLRTFGTLVGVGVLLGALVAARYSERWGIHREVTYRLATRMVVVGLIGARLTWVISHADDLDSPLDAFAVWEGGLQFSGGFIAAVLVAWPTMRTWSVVTRWRAVDGYALGLTLGLAFGRAGCYSVGEHFGGSTSFFLGVDYQSGPTREPVAGDVIHNTALYEGIHLLVLFALLWWLLHRRPAPAPGTGIGIFCLWYGTARFLTDFLRSYDDTFAGLTGAQWLMLAVIAAGVWVMTSVRRRTAALVVGEAEVSAE